MVEDFAFNAPQYADLIHEKENDNENLENYFEYDHESIDNTESFYSPMPFKDSYKGDEVGMRRSMSLGDLHIDRQHDDHDLTLTNNFNAIHLNESNSTTKSLQHIASTEHLNKLAQPKVQPQIEKYVSMAEAIRKYQNGTPRRFRSKSTHQMNALTTTIPQSPALMCKNRARPVHVIPFVEQEIIDFKEAQKLKVKSKPINQKVLKGPMKAEPIARKPITVPQPFKLTELPKKVAPPVPEQPPTFRAHPAPKSLLHEPTLQPRYQFPKKLQRAHSDQQLMKPKPAPLKKTIPEPFSFDSWPEKIRKKKEEAAKKLLDEEKKARTFQARPLPKFIAKDVMNKSGASSKASSRQRSEENLFVPFKPRPPTSLLKDPFVPLKANKPLTEISAFDLNTEKRAQERQAYDLYLKQEAARKEQLKRAKEEELARKQDEELQRLRRDTQYKAQPIKKFKELKITYSSKATMPISPLVTKHSKKNNKENAALE